ncbi:MAG: 50S ribosomal protein L18 [Candidatus Dormibacteraceae bacterium]
MLKRNDRRQSRLRRHRRVRLDVKGTGARPRLAVFRSLRHVYAQVIDDGAARTLASASTLQLKLAGHDIEAAASVGRALAERARAAGISRVVFDRGGYRYHGRVKALAEAARTAGLEF